MSSNSLVSVTSRDSIRPVWTDAWVRESIGSAGDEAEAGADLNRLLNVLFRRRWLIVACLAAGLLIAGVTVFSVTPQFTAQTRLLIETRQAGNAPIDTVVSGFAADDATFNSQVEVLRSRGLARRVMERSNLANDPEFNPALTPPHTLERLIGPVLGRGGDGLASDLPVLEALLRQLEVQPIEGSRVITLSFTSENPAKAAEIANAFADEYLRDRREAKLEATRGASLWLDGAVSELRAAVAASEQAVEDFRRGSGLIASGGVTLTSQETSGLNAELIRARAAAAAAEARLDQAQRLADSPSDVTSAAEVLDSPLIQSLREQEATIERRIAEMSAEFGPLHPRMAQLRAEAADLDASIAAETGKIIGRLENDASVARAQERSLNQQLEGLKTQLAENNEQEIQLRALEREAIANRNLLGTLLARYREVGSQSDRDVQRPDARVVSAADEPIVASFPNTRVILGLAAFGSLMLGGALAFFLELRDRTFRSGDEIEQALGVPSLGLIPLTPDLRKAGRRGELDSTVYRATRSAFSESLHTLHWSLSQANAGHSPRTVLVTSADSGEGKTTIALGLASSQALSGRRVLLVDADTRKCDLQRVSGMPEMSGLLNVLNGTAPEDVIVHDKVSGLDVMTAGRSSEASLPLLQSEALDTLLQKLGAIYDLIIFDSPPLSAVADACLLARRVDSTIFVVRWAATRQEVVEHALRTLRRADTGVAGVLLNMVDVRKHAAYLYGDSGKYQGRFAHYYGA